MRFKSSSLPYLVTVLLFIGAFFYSLPRSASANAAASAAALAPTDTSFTYQGRLVKSNVYVANAACDFQFGLYAGADAGDTTPLGTGIQSITGVPVRDGYFTVDLNFGPVFTGSARYLQIAVQCPPDESFTTLAPRVLLRAAPYAQFAHGAPWTGLTGIPAGFADGVDNDTMYTPGDGILVNGSTISANLAPGGGLSWNPNRQIRVDFSGSGSTSMAARSDHNHDATYLNGGDPAGGALTGTYPNPSLAVNAVGDQQIVDGAINSAKIADSSVDMADTVNWMGYSTSSMSFVSGTDLDLYTSTFTPSAHGVCLVTVSAYISSQGSASSGNAPQLEILILRNGTPSTDTSVNVPFSPADVSTSESISASSNYVWTVSAGQVTQFGCRVNDPDGTGNDWGNDETLRCRISYVCQ